MSRVTRRSLLGSATSLVGCCACGSEIIQNTAAVAQTVPGNAQYGVKALFFDVFGTLVDWRTGIAREAEAHLKAHNYGAGLARVRGRLARPNRESISPLLKRSICRPANAGWYLRPRTLAISLEHGLLACALPVSQDRTNLDPGLPHPFRRSRLMW